MRQDRKPNDPANDFEHDGATDAILDKVWDALCTGANPGPERSAYTMMQLATVGLDGSPKVRTIVLRRAHRQLGRLDFHTDARSEKVREILRDPRVALLASDVQAGIQLRLEGVARLVLAHDEKLAVWNSARPGTQVRYRTPVMPGSPIASPAQLSLSSAENPQQYTDGFENFCLIDVEINAIDYLDVSGDVHARARFFRGADSWPGQWIAP